MPILNPVPDYRALGEEVERSHLPGIEEDIAEAKAAGDEDRERLLTDRLKICRDLINSYKAQAEECERALEDVRALAKWLYGEDRIPGFSPGKAWSHLALMARFAPSIITRSEAELFGVSSPRFAMRMDPCSNNPSFVNVRRLDTLASQKALSKWWRPDGTAYELGQDEETKDLIPDNLKTPGALIRGETGGSIRCSSIADALLTPPDRIRKLFHVLTVELGRAYGEDRDVFGTPFVNHVRFGGGMCAQAAAFMATALLENDARGVYGVAEITAFGNSTEDGTVRSPLPLHGLSVEEIRAYFQHDGVRLNGRPQYFRDFRAFATGQATPNDPAVLYRVQRVLSSYLLSGMPIILPADLNRIYHSADPKFTPATKQARNRFEGTTPGDHPIVAALIEKIKKDPTRRDHMVLLNGVEKDEPSLESGNREFLMSDPSTYPFIRISTSDVIDIHWAASDDDPVVVYVPVTPRKVKMPLFTSGVTGTRSEVRQLPDGSVLRNKWNARGENVGLFDLLFEFRNYFAEQGDTEAIPDRLESEFRLVDLRKVGSRVRVGHDKADGEDWDYLASVFVPLVVADAVRVGVENGWLPRKWAWLQWKKAESPHEWRIAVWDAECDSIPIETFRTDRALPWKELWANNMLLGIGGTAVAGTPGFWRLRERSGGVFVRHEYEGGRPAPSTTTPTVVPPKAAAAPPVSEFSPPEDARLNLSLISSCLVSHCDRTDDPILRIAPKPAIDIYAFMSPKALNGYLGHLVSGIPGVAPAALAGGNAVEVMASLADAGPAAATRLAQEISDYYDGHEIVGIASFTPEAASPIPSFRRTAEKALRFLWRLSNSIQAIRSTDGNLAPYPIIELVAGSRMGCIGTELGPPGPEIEANVRRDARTIDLLLETLRGVLQEESAHEIDDDRDSPVFAIELEPGPLFSVRDQATLQLLCQRLDLEVNETLNKFTGLNLDICHWRIAGLKPPADGAAIDVTIPMDILNRVVHAHISGHHHNSHLGDLELLASDHEAFVGWLQLLSRLRGKSHARLSRIRYKGHVAIELEATKLRDSLQDTCSVLRRWTA